MRNDRGRGAEIIDWFETFLKVVCWEYQLEPKIPYHDLAAEIVKHLEPERPGVTEKILPWRKQGKNQHEKTKG